jgi:hypothetical protein
MLRPQAATATQMASESTSATLGREEVDAPDARCSTARLAQNSYIATLTRPAATRIAFKLCAILGDYMPQRQANSARSAAEGRLVRMLVVAQRP